MEVDQCQPHEKFYTACQSSQVVNWVKTKPKLAGNRIPFRGTYLVFYCVSKVSFFGTCSKMQIIPIKNLNIKKVVPQFLWFFRLKCWFKGQIISRIHLSLPNAYKWCVLIEKSMEIGMLNFDWDYWSLHWWKKATLPILRLGACHEVLGKTRSVLWGLF